MIEKATMHRQEEIEIDLQNHNFITDELIFFWHKDTYSTSKHLLSLYSIVRGLQAKIILEIGFGRSSFVLARAAHENNGRLITCDNRDFRYLLSNDELTVTDYKLGSSELVWTDHDLKKTGIDFAFLDYFSSEEITENFVKNEIKHCLKLLKTNAVIVVHDVLVEKYAVGKVLRSLCRWNRNIEYSVLPYNYGLGVIHYTGSSPFGSLKDLWLKQ